MTEDSAVTADDGAIEIRPVTPPGRLWPADTQPLRKWVLRVNPADGTMVFAEDRPFIITPIRTLILALPSSGRPDAVYTVCLSDHVWQKNLQTGITWQLLFLDREGRVLAAGRKRDEPRASQMWPVDLFKPLETAGVAVTQERYASPKALRHVHPKA
jgi:hypothetical protein